MSNALSATCHCGAVGITIPAAPDYLNDCNCSLCVTRGGLWGYFSPADVTISGETHGYIRADLKQAALSTHWCAHCGSTTHWTALDPAYDRMGVNMRLFDPAAYARVEIRPIDGRSWEG
ncbi:MAG: GFA family protein [Sphingomonas sp.]|nr:GFA family protein [Sphingomonas sp.]